MNRIDKKFRDLLMSGRKAFIAYITAGDGGLAMTGRMVLALEKAGADVIELGIPFSDPMADGPTIQAASQRALRAGMTLEKIFRFVRGLRNKTGIPIAFMTYYNVVLKYGIGRFFANCRASGVDGVIIPDLPCEEAGEASACARKTGTDTIFLASPTSTRARIEKIAKSSTGFIYYVSLTGVTGARAKLASDIRKNLKAIKSVTDKPVAVGFGVSNAAQARDLAKASDGVIVGSAIVKIIEKNKNVIENVSGFAKGLARAIHNV